MTKAKKHQIFCAFQCSQEKERRAALRCSEALSLLYCSTFYHNYPSTPIYLPQMFKTYLEPFLNHLPK